MPTALTRQTVLDTVRQLPAAEPIVFAEAARALRRLVHGFGGDPIVRTGKGAPLEHRAVAELARRGSANRSADQAHVTVDVARTSGIDDSPESWQASAYGAGWASRAAWASDAGIDVVGHAW